MEINTQIKRLHVKSISLAQNEDVYDITVRKNHNFFANGILVHNCVEIGMYPVTESGVSGFQFCNLTEINGGKCVDVATFDRAAKAAAIMGTLQAGYTNFKYVSDATREITAREALIGVSITGWMNNPDILFNTVNMTDGAQSVNYWNEIVAEMIGIRQAARTTCVKPSGNASVILGTASGIHGEHSPLYIRHVQMNENDEVLQLMQKQNPSMVRKSVWSANGTDYVVAFPIISKEGSIYKSTLMGVKQLDFVKKAQQVWVEAGTNVELCRHPKLRHNVSNTITVDNWDEVEQYLFDNRAFFAGVSLLSAAGDRAYAQAPFTEVFTAQQIMDLYGTGSVLASGLIVDALPIFGSNLWLACETVLGMGMKLSPDSSEHLLARDWVRRAKKFADNFFDGDVAKMTYCLKDCYNLHKWSEINRTIKPIDFSKELSKQQYVDADTMAAAGCSGGTCEISF